MKRLLAGLAFAIFSTACVPAINPEYRDVVESTFPLVTPNGKVYCTSTKIGDDLLLTAAHCVSDGMPGMILRQDGQLKSFKVKKMDEENDLALLTADVDGRTAEIQTLEPDTYSDVIAAGYPVGAGLVITKGMWVGKFFDSSYVGHMLASISVGPGNSGGGLWTKESGRWKLLAVVQFYAPVAQHVCGVSAIDTLQGFLRGATD